MTWKQQKFVSLLAIAAALVVNCLPIDAGRPAPERTASVSR